MCGGPLHIPVAGYGREGRWRRRVAHRQGGQGWFFVSETEPRVSRRKARKGRKKGPQVGLVRPLYAGPTDLALRVPELSPMRNKTIALFGVGTLGAQAAVEFARAGVRELRILDGDFVDAGPVVRWPFGLRDAGRPKVEVIHEFLSEQYPYTRVVPEEFKLGDLPAPNRKSDQRVLDEMMKGADLVFDATADVGVQKFLADLCRERELPYLSVVGRHGAWGGVIFRHVPGRVQGCWCGDVTFTGTSFDMGTIALDAVRRAVGTLCAPDDGYPDGDWDVAVISLRQEDGSACSPRWEEHPLPPREGCTCHPESP